MVSQSVICKHCHNTAVVKYGTFEGMQRYFCKSCRRKFADNDALPKMKTPIWVIASALSQYYDGKSLTTIQDYLNRRYGAVYAKSSIYNWVIRFSNEALALIHDYQPVTGDAWLAIETSLTVGTHKNWLWDVVDTSTGYLLDSSLTLQPESRTSKFINSVVSRRTGKPAEIIITFRSGENEKTAESVWYRSSQDIHQLHSNIIEDNAGLIGRFQTALKTRKAVLRGYKNIVTAHLLVNTWQMHYNYFKSFTTLGHTPPGQNMPNPPVKTWLDVINQIKYKNLPAAGSLLQIKRLDLLPPESLRELPIKGKYT